MWLKSHPLGLNYFQRKNTSMAFALIGQEASTSAQNNQRSDSANHSVCTTTGRRWTITARQRTTTMQTITSITQRLDMTTSSYNPRRRWQGTKEYTLVYDGIFQFIGCHEKSAQSSSRIAKLRHVIVPTNPWIFNFMLENETTKMHVQNCFLACLLTQKITENSGG